MRRFPLLAKDAAHVSVRYAVSDYATDLAEYRRQMADALISCSDSHYRINVHEESGVGRYEFHGLADGFFLKVAQSDYCVPQSAYLQSPDSLHIYLASSGDGEYVPVDGTPLSFEAPSSVLIIEPAGQPPAEITLAGFTRYVYIVLHRDALRTMYAGSLHELPGFLQAFLEGDVRRTCGRTLPLSAAMLRCLEDMQSCSLDGHRRRLFLQSKAIEIICLTLEAADQAECFGSAKSSKHIAKGVLKAQRYLASNFVSPPPLEDLAAEVGMSRSALCAGFRQMLGQSVYEYIRDLRMELALSMLSEGDSSIIQIAYAVGYNRPSSFSVAVQRHFGATPSELRRRSGLLAS